MAKKLKMIFSYEDTEFTRPYDFAVADSIDAADCKAAILGINASLKNSTDDGLADFFVSDAGENFTLISAAQLEEIETTVLNLNIGGDSAASI